MGEWKALQKASGTGWKELLRQASSSNDYFATNGIYQATYTIITPPGTYHNNKTFVVWSGASLNPYAIEYNHTTKTLSSQQQVGVNPLSGDGHGTPCIIRGSDGYLHVFYGCHGTSGCLGDKCYIQHAKSNSADNISAWTDKGNICDFKATYPNPILIGSDIYLFYRLHVSGNWFREVYSKSTDQGENWSAADIIIDAGTGYCVYVGQVEEEGSTKIHISWTLYVYSVSEHRFLYHAYLKLSDMHMYGMDGVDLGTTISKAEMDAHCLVYDSGSDAMSVCGRVHVHNGIPYTIFLHDDSGFKVKFTKWTGSAWSAPVTITSTDSDNNCLDFIIHSSTNIEAYIVSSGEAGIGGDIEKWIYNGSTWSKDSTVLAHTVYGKALAFPLYVKNYNSNFKFVFSEFVGDYTTSVKVFGHGSSGFVRNGEWRELLWETAYEDFTTFTEVDIAADRIQKTANHVDHIAYRNEDTYLYKDYGVGHFGNFTHKIKWKGNIVSSGAMGIFWVVANNLDDVKGLDDNNYSHLRLVAYDDSRYIYLYENHNGTLYFNGPYTFTNDTWYYIKIVKSGTSLNAYIYSDSSYSNLLHTLSLTLHSDQTNRYLYACNTYNTGNSYGMTQDIENFDLG